MLKADAEPSIQTTRTVPYPKQAKLKDLLHCLPKVVGTPAQLYEFPTPVAFPFALFHQVFLFIVKSSSVCCY